MPAKTGQRIKLVAIVDILKKYSDDMHPVNALEICEKLAAMGIPAERKAVYKDIDLLVDYGFDICKTRTPSVGFFLASRDFEVPEIYLLCDAVQAASFITVKKSRELTKKLTAMLSVGEASKISKGIYIGEGHKSSNESIYYNIDTLSEAVKRHKKVTLVYFVRSVADNRQITIKEKTMTVSPYALVWQNDHYYLICNNEKYDNLMHLRVDRIKNAEMTKKDWRHFSEVSEYKEEFNAVDYANKSFNMFSGELSEIELRCDSELLEQVIDRFSENVTARKVENGKFSVFVKAYLSDGLVSWIMQFGKEMEVIKPEKLRKMISDRAKEIKDIYN